MNTMHKSSSITVNPERNHSLSGVLVKRAFIDSFRKLNPIIMVKNPVLFVVEIGFLLTLMLTLFPSMFGSESQLLYNGIVSVILLFTLLFANFAESLAEGRGKAQAESLKKSKQNLSARVLLKDGSLSYVSSTELKRDDIILVEAGELIASDGEIISGLASVDESAISGESAPVIKQAGGDFSSVTGGTRVISDSLTIRITSNPGETFLDRMISLVEGAKRQKTPNEIALNTLLVSLTLIFLIVCITLVPISSYVGVLIPVATLVALLVCLIPTTIGGLLSAIGIAGMDRVTKFNVIAKSGKAVESAGDINTIILDKTGTITHGNRMASEFITVDQTKPIELTKAALLSSLHDTTPEGRSIVEFTEKLGVYEMELNLQRSVGIDFNAQTRMSGTDFENGLKVRKGAVDAVKAHVLQMGGSIPVDLDEKTKIIASEGGTPLAVSINNQIVGLIYLKDTVKAGLKERFEQLSRMGIKTIMCTGDNPLTAATIAREAGIDEFIAEARPEDKIAVIKREQAAGKMVAMTGDGTNDAPALAQADVGMAMNSGTVSAKEAANMVDLDSDPTKIIEVVGIGKQLLMTRGALTTFSIANDIAKYFAIIPAMFMMAIPEMSALNIMDLATPQSAILSALIFNAVIIPLLIPLAMKGIKYVPIETAKLLKRNLLIYGGGGVIAPFIGIKLIDLLLVSINLI